MRDGKSGLTDFERRHTEMPDTAGNLMDNWDAEDAAAGAASPGKPKRIDRQGRFLQAITEDIAPEDILNYVGLPPSKFFRMLNGRQLRRRLAMRQAVVDAKVEHQKMNVADAFMHYLSRMTGRQDSETFRRILMDVLKGGDEIKAPSGDLDRIRAPKARPAAPPAKPQPSAEEKPAALERPREESHVALRIKPTEVEAPRGIPAFALPALTPGGSERKKSS